MSAFSKAIESILKSFSTPAQKQAGEISTRNATKPASTNANNDIMPSKNQQGQEVKTQNKMTLAKQQLAKIDTSKLTHEQHEVLKVFKGEIPSTNISGKDLNDLYTLERGSRQQGARKILIRHYGLEKAGGLNNDELLNMSEIIKNGKILNDSLQQKDGFLRYGYEVEKDGAKLRLVVDEYNDGKKIFDLYSDRNIRDNKPNLPNPDIFNFTTNKKQNQQTIQQTSKFLRE